MTELQCKVNKTQMETLGVGNNKGIECSNQAQCQFFVVRKKRLCRMTVRPGREYCGEHEPQPKTEKGQEDTRMPCPYDPKHTCYTSKLSKHLAICNARPTDLPDYIIYNINAPLVQHAAPRLQLSQVPQQQLLALIDKVNILYDKYVKDAISTISDQPIHEAVMSDFMEKGRTESSLRHLRQVSSLMHLMETEELVQDGTCYVELGAGKGQLSYYAWRAWCAGAAGGASRVLLVDRAALRHKRDNKLAGGVRRVRADLAHLALHRAPHVQHCAALVGLAKHLCGAATDYALRCMAGVAGAEAGAARVRGVVLATCCHHRCEPAAYVGSRHLQDMGITEEDLNIMLGVVSWATCGDGRGRGQRAGAGSGAGAGEGEGECGAGPGSGRAAAGRRAKALLDYGRVRYLRGLGMRARLCRYVPPHVTLENMAIVASADGDC